MSNTTTITFPGKYVRISNSEGQGWGVYWKTGVKGCNRHVEFFDDLSDAKAFVATYL